MHPKLDVTQTLYDNDGYSHTLVQATSMQLLTVLEGFYWLWDRSSGKCLLEGMTNARLSNTRPTAEEMRTRRYPIAEMRAFFLAQKVVQVAAKNATAITRTAQRQLALSTTLQTEHPLSTRWTAMPHASFQTLRIPREKSSDSFPLMVPNRSAERITHEEAEDTQNSGFLMAMALGLLGAMLLAPGASPSPRKR